MKIFYSTFTAGKPNYEWPDEAFPYGPNPHRLFRITTTEAPPPTEWQLLVENYYLDKILLIIAFCLLAMCLGCATVFGYKVIKDWRRKHLARQARVAQRARLIDPANFHLRSNAWN
ncbi:hypothetical protein PRIPAC_95986 [Pristionchus pacificus]|uniref:Uncharacterized protein n=1 Tax=Pristionchus pacificus TaxID=54126 RepID=A0A2A6BJK6_PRIPA|nr:hypothetical protein PRIPAC_95986 [Pristionchus pacificus]|eukprot:PDM66079.1 hypothetical protein PRIPAC_45304 [Pristionchus pacificus]